MGFHSFVGCLLLSSVNYVMMEAETVFKMEIHSVLTQLVT
jgi:hypothetical protein